MKKTNDSFVSGADFEAYVTVQRSGVTNMFDVARVCDLSDLTREQVLNIMENYAHFEECFGTALAPDSAGPDAYVKSLGE